MSYPVHEVFAGDVLPIFFSTYAGSTGASITMTGLAVTDLEVYKDGSVTQRASDAGYTLLDTDGIDFDGITGIHGFSINTGDNTDAGFYTVGAWFHVVVSAVTVDGQTVNFIAAAFRIVKAESVAGVPKTDVDAWLGTAAATPTVAGVPEVDVTHWIGTAAATPTVAGVPEVDVTHWIGTAAATPSVAGVPEVDLTHVAGATTNVSALATNVAAVLADTGTDGVVISAATHITIADAILKRDFAAVTGEAARSLMNAARFLVNKRSVSGGTLTVTKEDDTTAAWTAAVTTTAGNPTSGVDPA